VRGNVRKRKTSKHLSPEEDPIIMEDDLARGRRRRGEWEFITAAHYSFTTRETPYILLCFLALVVYFLFSVLYQRTSSCCFLCLPSRVLDTVRRKLAYSYSAELIQLYPLFRFLSAFFLLFPPSSISLLSLYLKRPSVMPTTMSAVNFTYIQISQPTDLSRMNPISPYHPWPSFFLYTLYIPIFPPP
jgi:hypothetical protein